jgi:PPOX class probable F420-dependent enzyme
MNTTEREVQVGSDRISFLVTSSESPDGLIAAEVEMPPGGGPPLLHRHAPAEVYRVEEGEFAFYLGSEDGRVERQAAGPGQTVHIAENRQHTIRNESERPARAFVVFTPGAAMERFFRSAGSLEDPSPDEVIHLAARHGIEMTGPLPGGAGQPIPRALADTWAMLLETRKRSGDWVGTPVNVAADGGRVFFSTGAKTAKVKRLRNFPDVRVAPCSPRGKPKGEAMTATARLLDGEDARRAREALTRDYPIVFRMLVPLEMRLMKTRALFYELTELRADESPSRPSRSSLR